MSTATESADTPDLEALFDSIASATSAAAARTAAAPAADALSMEERHPDKVMRQIGQMTRDLHDALRQLGYDKVLHSAASKIPDARDRLAYIAAKTEEAAGRVLNATDAASPIQEQLGSDAARLSTGWDRLFGNQLGVDEFNSL